MEGAVGAEFLHDWEVLHDSNTKSELSGNNNNNNNNPGGIEEHESDSESIIKSDYFSLSNEGRHMKAEAERDLSDGGSVESDNPSWIDPGSENRYGRTNFSGEFWSDSGSDRSDERKFNEFDSKIELGLVGNEEIQLGHGELGIESQKLKSLETYESNISGFDSKNESVFTESAKKRSRFEGFDEIQSQSKDLSKFWADSGGDELVSAKFGDVGRESETGRVDSEVKMEGVVDGSSDENKSLPMEAIKVNEESNGVGEEKRKVVWWKVPFEVLRYCMFKANPVWSISVAAAVMGFIILGRKLYKMKRKSQGLQLKVALDDKKVSQFMSRAARLNEAFSVVRRVPMVRPALPATGINPWPAMSMR